MEALSPIISGLIEEFPICKKENKTIWKFIAKCQNPELIIQQYPKDFDQSSAEGSQTNSLKHFCDRNRKQDEGIVIAYVSTIFDSIFLKAMLTAYSPSSQFPACISGWVQVSDSSHAMIISFNLSRTWMTSFCQRIPRKLSLPNCSPTADIITLFPAVYIRTLFETMKKSMM
jgi:hypothetical protein